MKARIAYLLKFYLTTLALFIGAKVVFMLCNAPGHDVTLGDYVAVVAHGLSLDLSTALYFLLVPFLVTVLNVWIVVPRWVLKGYCAVVAVAFALAFVADTSLYPFWGFKLDATCLQYLEQPEGITASVSVGYLALRALALCVVAYFGYKVLAAAGRAGASGTPGASGTSKTFGGDRPFLETAVYVACVPAMVVGIRGGVTESTTNIGQVYFSQNQFLNHAAVNPVFSFLYSLGHQVGDLSQYDFMDDERCQQLLDGVYTTESSGTDTLLTTTHPDIVIVLLESAGEQFASVMPRLQQLKQQGISFTRCYANSWRTDRGTVCTLSGYPSFPSLSVMKIPEKSRTLPSIARALRQQGYETTYLYGGDINFTNMRSYLISTGWTTLVNMDDYSSTEQSTAQWGVRDDITFGTLLGWLTGNSGQGQPSDGQHCSSSSHPRLYGYSTLSSHEPWDVPTHTHSDEVLNAFAYLDCCIGDFVDSLRQTPAWQNLLVVITADHGINHNRIDQSTPLEKNHIPMLWIGGAVREPRQIDVICNQTDLAATLLSQLRLPHDDFAFSRDILSSTYCHPVAVHNYNNAQWVIDSTGHMLYDFDARRFIVDDATDAQRLLSISQSILQLTTRDLRER